MEAEQGDNRNGSYTTALGFWLDADQHPKCSYSSQSWGPACEGLAAVGRAPGSCFDCFPSLQGTGRDVPRVTHCLELPRHLRPRLLHGKVSGMLPSHPHHGRVPGDGADSREQAAGTAGCGGAVRLRYTRSLRPSSSAGRAASRGGDPDQGTHQRQGREASFL